MVALCHPALTEVTQHCVRGTVLTLPPAQGQSLGKVAWEFQSWNLGTAASARVTTSMI